MPTSMPGESPVPSNGHAGFGGAGRGNGPPATATPRPGPTLHKKGHKYLTVVVDHDTRRLVWAAPGRDVATLGRFFDALGEQRCAQVRLVSADAAGWIAVTVAARCPGATLCADPFHVAGVGHRRAG